MEDTKRCRGCKSLNRLLLFLLLFLAVSPVKSQTNDSLRISLLTVVPQSRAVWTIFGHTALRVSDPTRNIDAVLNWGTFDSQKPNFILRFIEGKTDYLLGLNQAPVDIVYQFLQYFCALPAEQKNEILKHLNKSAGS